MKIAMPVNDKSVESGVCPSFGRAPYYMIYDTETKENVFIENSAAASQGGAGIRAAQTITDSKVDAIIAPRCGGNAAEVIKAAGIRMYRTINDSIKDNIDALSEGKLPALEDIHAGFHRHGGV